MANAVTIVSEPCYVLELSKAEAQLILGLTSNYVGGDPIDESTAEKETRESIWHALDEEGV